MVAHTFGEGEFKICNLIIFYQYNGVLSVLVVESCPSVVACGQGGGVPPPDVGRGERGVARMEFDYSYSIYAILSLPTDVSVLVVPCAFISMR